MAGTLKEITENYEKLHRLQMIEMILKTTYDFVDNTVRGIAEDFDNYEDFDDEATDIIIKNVKENLATLDKYLNDKPKEDLQTNH